MLTGQPYKHYLDPTLVRDQNACYKAMYRWNHAKSALGDKSVGDLAKLFLDILDPAAMLERERLSEDDERRKSEHPPPANRFEHHHGPPGSTFKSSYGPKGDVAELTNVEAPFRCDFGYHLHIGGYTSIGPNCYFQDAGGIYIGNNVVIKAGVQLVTMEADAGEEERKGSQGLFKAGMIEIQDGAIIGDGAIIWPYVTVGKNAVVKPGAVVSKVGEVSSRSLRREADMFGRMSRTAIL